MHNSRGVIIHIQVFRSVFQEFSYSRGYKGNSTLGNDSKVLNGVPTIATNWL